MRRITLILTLLAFVACVGRRGSTTTTGDVATTTTRRPTRRPAAPDPTTTAADAGIPGGGRGGERGGHDRDDAGEHRLAVSDRTEMLFAIGAGEQVVAVDDFSTYPEDAPTSDLSGFEPNLEAIAAYEPDLVVVSDDINDVVASLGAIEIPSCTPPAAQSLDESRPKSSCWVRPPVVRTRRPDLVASMQEEIDGW